MSKYEAYPEYKDSGVEWINEIPAQWSSMSFGKAVQFMSNGASATQIEENKDTVRVTRIETISAGVINLDKVGHVRRFDIPPRFRLQRGDIQFSNINSLSMVGNCAIFVANAELFAGMNLLHIRPDYNRVHSKYMLYQLKTKWFRNSVEANAKPAINQASIPTGTLKQLGFLCPSLEEQEIITNFLDHETAKIDTLIDKQQQLIQLLKEKRQAVISHAVTKGLNPNAPMRDSGVEWLGEVPEHWKIWKFRHIAPIITCGIASTPTYVDGSEGVAFLSAQNIRENKLSLHKYNYITHDLHEQLTKYRKPEVGDLLVTRVGAGIGEACVVNIDMEFSIYVSLTHIRVDPAVALNTFVMYFFGSDYCKYLNYQGTVTGGGVGNLNVQNVERYKLPLPNLEEQQKIVNYLDFEGERFSALIKKSELAIKLMQERRTALISAAVTGKIDVRHHVSRPAGNDTIG